MINLKIPPPSSPLLLPSPLLPPFPLPSPLLPPLLGSNWLKHCQPAKYI